MGWHPVSAASAGSIWPASWRSGRYYYPDANPSLSTANLSANVERARSFVPPASVTLSRIGGQVNGAGDVGSKIRFGIRADDGTGRPGTLALDAGVIAGDSNSTQEVTISMPVVAGVPLWYTSTVQLVSSALPTLDVISGGLSPWDLGTAMPTPNNANGGRFQSGVAGALPATWTDAGTVIQVMRTFVKVA